MLKIDRTTMSVQAVPEQKLASAGLKENEFRDMLIKNGNEVFKEMSESLLVVGKEVCPSDTVADRIDILGIDPQGNSVVIELKRYENKLQLFQGLSYAAMLSDWEEEDFISELSNHAKIFDIEESRRILKDNLDTRDGEGIEINKKQRIILIAEKFDFALLKATEWLFDNYGVDIKCYEITSFKDESSDYVSFHLVFPPRELAEQASKRGRRKVGKFVDGTSFDDTSIKTGSEIVKAFFEHPPISAERTSKGIACRVGGERRLFAEPRKASSYCWQHGRFDNDLDFWRGRLSQPSRVAEVNSNKSLRFYLFTQDDFEALRNVIDSGFSGIVFKDYDEN
jgi:hypothetical protein